MRKWLFAVGAVAFVSGGIASAQLVVNAAGPIDSSGPAGDAANGIITATYGGPNTIFGTLNFRGDLTAVIPGTWASEARWRIRNTTIGYLNDFQPSTTTSFTGTINITASRGLVAWANSGDNFSFEAFESFNDGAGPDAQWTNVNFTFNAATLVNIGDYSPGAFDINTFTSNYDTELGLYASDGTLLASNDDASGLQSQILTNLGNGTYYIVLGGFNTTYATGIAIGGNAAGDYVLNVNGTTVASGTSTAGQLNVYCFRVPEPTSALLLSLGALALLRRR